MPKINESFELQTPDGETVATLEKDAEGIVELRHSLSAERIRELSLVYLHVCHGGLRLHAQITDASGAAIFEEWGGVDRLHLAPQKYLGPNGQLPVQLEIAEIQTGTMPDTTRYKKIVFNDLLFKLAPI